MNSLTVLVSGLGSTPGQWNDEWKAALSTRNNPVVEGVLPGHDGKPGCEHTLGGMVIDDYADHILHLIEGTGVQSAKIVGHSLGWQVARRVAIKAPGLVSRLVNLNGAVHTGSPVRLQFGKPSYIWAMLTGSPFKLKEPEEHWITDGATKLGPESGYVALELLMGFSAPHVSCPILAIGGKGDHVVRPADMEREARHDEARFEAIDGGHMFHMDPKVIPILIPKVASFLKAS